MQTGNMPAVALILLVQSFTGFARVQVTYSPPGAEYRIVFPSEPTEKFQDQTHFLQSQAPNPGPTWLYALSYYDLESTPADVDALLESVSRQPMREDWAVVSKAEIQLDLHQGLAVVYSVGRGMSMTSRLYVVGMRVYRLSVVVDSGFEDNPAVTAFFSSFAVESQP